MLNEIGGYFELEHYFGEPYHDGLIPLNSGRGCISYLVELRHIAAIWLPDWMCDSVTRRFVDEGVDIKTYSIGRDFLPVYDFEVGQDEWLYLMDYYGQLTSQDVARALEYSNGKLLVDETQGFFRAPWKNCDTTYTCRKWFGVSDGAYVATSDGATMSRKLPVDESHGRLGFVLGRFERPASEFFGDSQRNNELFDDEPAKLMSPITENLLNAINYEQVIEKRQSNWKILHKALMNVNDLHLILPEGPFMYPLLSDRAGEMREVLIKNRIYVPVLWPNVVAEGKADSVAFRYSSSILPLPVDQRYGDEEMNRILDVLSTAGVSVG